MNKIIGVVLLAIYSLGIQAQNRRTAATDKQAVSLPTKSTTTEKVQTTSPSKEQKIEEVVAPKKMAPGSAFLSPSSEAMKMSTTIEFGGYPSDADITVVNIYGHLGLNFDLGRRFHIGPYFKHKILSTHSYEVMTYEGINYDISSFKEWGTGLSVGAYFPLGRTLLINPELRTGYNEFTIQSPSFDSLNNNFIYRNFINFTPRLNFSLKLSEYTLLNFGGGYIFPFFLGKSDPVPHYNPNTFMYGLGIRFYLQK